MKLNRVSERLGIESIRPGDIITIGEHPFRYRAVETLDEAGYKCIRLEWAGWTDAFIDAVDSTGLKTFEENTK